MPLITLPDPRFAPLGRHDPAQEKACLWWSGSGIRVSLACTVLEADITWDGTAHSPWIGVTVDGAPVCRFPLTAGTRRYTLLSGLDGSVAHEIAVVRDSQPVQGSDAGPVVIESVATDGEPAAPAERPLLIEFLGDSLTVGEGTLGPVSADEWRTAWISVLSAFPALVSERMNADMRVFALGGWGASRSWDDRTENRIGRVYDQLCAVIPGGEVPADFPERQADAVVINLGTNDGSAILCKSGEERAEAENLLCRRAAELMTEARNRNPRAKLLWAYGLCGKPMEPILKRAVETYLTDGGHDAAYLSLTTSSGTGSRSHPDRDSHRRAAEEIVKKLREMGV